MTENQIKVPHFLVIGGMKCATTTLHDDLSRHASIECGKKELNALTQTDEIEKIRDIYRQNYSSARPQQVLGDISTTYSMLPEHPGVAMKAAKVCGDGLKLIYLVRDPVKRSLSHHQHMMNDSGAGKMGSDINLEIHNQPAIIAYSCYFRQLQPWIETFGMSNILVVSFEDYVSQRQQALNSIFDFLEVAHAEIEVEPEGVNRSENRRVAAGLISTVYRTQFFQKYLQPNVPDVIRHAFRKLLLAKAKSTRVPPEQSTIDMIIEGVAEDVLQMQQLLHRDQPLWDLEKWRKSGSTIA